MTKFKLMLKFVFKHKFKFLCEFFCVNIAALVALTFPYLNGKLINVIFYDTNISVFFHFCLIYAGIFFFNRLIVASIGNFMWVNLMTSFVFDIRWALLKKILHKKGKDLSSLHSGDMISRINNDVTDFMDFIYKSCIGGCSYILCLIISLFFMFYYNIYLGISSLILIPIVFYTSMYFKKKSQIINKDILHKKGELSSFLFEIIKNFSELKVLNATKKVTRIYTKNTTVINKMNVKSGKIDIVSERINSLITLAVQLIVFVICSYFIVNDKMQIGAFVAALSYFNIAVGNFNSINNTIVNVGKQAASIQRVADILNEEEENYKEDVKEKNLSSGKIEFKNVTFGYRENKKILNDLNLIIDGGTKIALVGKSGVGKTTLVNLIYNLYSVDSGILLIDDVNINDYNLKYLRSQIGIVHQENILYNGTLRYNISFSNSTSNDEKLIIALKKAALYDFFLSLKNGLDTILGEGGQDLSGGQKQLLAIARIFFKSPKILIFDEATSSLDSQNEEIIRQKLNEVSKNHTVLIISHRFSTIKDCDKIALLSDGMIENIDSHDNLIRNNPTYFELFHDQIIGETI